MGGQGPVKSGVEVREPHHEAASGRTERLRRARRSVEGWLAGTLFALTGFSTLLAGALLRGGDPLAVEFGVRGGIPFWWPTTLELDLLLSGWPFAAAFMGILLAHEWAHRVAAARHGVPTSLPFFIPFPPHVSVIGTLGAFIRLRGQVPHRKALLDVGLAGPIASLLLSVPVLAVGLVLSTPSEVPVREGLPFFILFHEMPIRLGEPLLVQAMNAILPIEGGDGALLLHPLAFAGWLGLMLTFLNLLPLARLDGGHILHALDPARQRWWTGATVLVFLTLGFIWAGWWVWALVMALLGRSRPLPPGAVGREPLPSPARRRVAWAVLVMVPFLLPPVPVAL